MAAISEREDLLLAYAAGLLPPAHSLVVASQAALRGDVRRAVGDYEAIGGLLLAECEPAPLSAGLRQRVMAALDEEPPPQGDPRPPPQGVSRLPPQGDPRLPPPLWGYLEGGLEAQRWRRLGPGARDLTLAKQPGSTLRLMWVSGGTTMPAHSHRGLELTLVLEGAFADCTGAYGPGELQMADEAVDHSPAVAPGPDCLCLVASAAPIRLTGRIGRLFNPLIRY